MTLSQIDALRADVREQDAAFHMDEDTFRVFYERTARGLSAYLTRLTGDRQVSPRTFSRRSYYRFLRVATPFESDTHRRELSLPHRDQSGARSSSPAPRRSRVDRRRGRSGARRRAGRPQNASSGGAICRGRWPLLRQRDRELLWLAYAHGSTHQEIAAALGLKTGSIKLLLFRARHRLANLIRQRDGRLTEEHPR